MMYGSQYQSTMYYTWTDPTRPERPTTEVITDIPQYYEGDINQIIMLGTPQMGSWKVNAKCKI
jgi:hypothetical protein